MKIEISKRYIKDYLVSFISLTNKNNFKVVLCSLGASIYSIYMRNKYGYIENVIMTPAVDEEFLDTESYYGKIIGRTSGRISNASFT